MKQLIPTIGFALISIVLAVLFYSAKQETAMLEAKLEAAENALELKADASQASEAVAMQPEEVVVVKQSQPEAVEPVEAVPEPEKKTDAGRRMMDSMAKMMENPTMNKVMEASQRGAVGALYADLIDYLGLNKEETGYFMDLLMFRQMKQVDLGMKMMGGNLSEEEKQKMMDELKEAADTVESEMEKFLNNAEDFDEFKFYEKTMGERMMLSQMDKDLGTGNALSDEAYRNLLGMMHDEKQDFNFTSDLHDQKNTDMSPERFSKENLQNFGNDMDQLNASILSRAQTILTPEQYEAFKGAVNQTAEMQKAQLEMAAQMFGGGK